MTRIANAKKKVFDGLGLNEVLSDKTLVKFIYLAHFRPGKKHVWLVRAIASVFQRHPEARLILCGQDLYGVAKRVQTVIKEEGLEKQIIMPGLVPREKIPALLGYIDCAIVASHAETFGFSYIEPMFMGLPVIGTPVGVGEEVVINGDTGMLIDLKRPASLSRSIEYILQNRDHAKEMGKKARMVVHSRFTYSAVAQELVNLYTKTLGG